MPASFIKILPLPRASELICGTTWLPRISALNERPLGAAVGLGLGEPVGLGDVVGEGETVGDGLPVGDGLGLPVGEGETVGLGLGETPPENVPVKIAFPP